MVIFFQSSLPSKTVAYSERNSSGKNTIDCFDFIKAWPNIFLRIRHFRCYLCLKDHFQVNVHGSCNSISYNKRRRGEIVWREHRHEFCCLRSFGFRIEPRSSNKLVLIDSRRQLVSMGPLLPVHTLCNHSQRSENQVDRDS